MKLLVQPGPHLVILQVSLRPSPHGEGPHQRFTCSQPDCCLAVPESCLEEAIAEAGPCAASHHVASIRPGPVKHVLLGADTGLAFAIAAVPVVRVESTTCAAAAEAHRVSAETIVCVCPPDEGVKAFRLGRTFAAPHAAMLPNIRTLVQ